MTVPKKPTLGTHAPKGATIGIAVSQYHTDVTGKLLKSCLKTLIDHGVAEKNINVMNVPGAFELPLACQRQASSKKYDAVIALGCLIQGETPHFDFIAFAVAQGIMEVSIRHGLPVIFGVLTTENLKQAKDRTGGKKGDKGAEAALAALAMLTL